jgi:hypothetical protein
MKIQYSSATAMFELLLLVAWLLVGCAKLRQWGEELLPAITNSIPSEVSGGGGENESGCSVPGTISPIPPTNSPPTPSAPPPVFLRAAFTNASLPHNGEEAFGNHTDWKTAYVSSDYRAFSVKWPGGLLGASMRLDSARLGRDAETLLIPTGDRALRVGEWYQFDNENPQAIPTKVGRPCYTWTKASGATLADLQPGDLLVLRRKADGRPVAAMRAFARELPSVVELSEKESRAMAPPVP